MDMWVRNSTLMKKQYPDFYQRVISQAYSNKDLHVTVETMDNLQISSGPSKCYLHSSYSIEREMEQLFTGIEDDPNQTIIIFGLGLGYCLDYIRMHRIKYQTVVVLEPCNNILRKLMEKRDIIELLQMKNVSLNLFTDPMEIISQIMSQAMLSKNIKIISHLSYRAVFDQIYQEITRLVVNEKRVLLTTMATINFFLHEWTENQIKSLNRNDDTATIFNNRFRGIPAVIISAGPSVEKRIAELQEIGDQALIIAPGTGAKICKTNKLNAHMGMAMDSEIEEADLFEDSDIKILIGSYRLHPKIYQVYHHRIIRMLLGTEYIAKYYHEYFNIPIDITSDFASVSSSAIHFAVKLGCNPIILVGQDMCYYDYRFHAGEAEGSLSDAARARMVETKDINGEVVFTEDTFLALQRDMELLNLSIRNTNKLINASEAGIGIPGVENMSLREVLDQYILTPRYDVKAIIDKCLNDLDSMGQTERPHLEMFGKMLEELNQLAKINSEKAEELSKLQVMLEKGLKDNRLYNQLQAIREKNDRLQENDFYKTAVIPILERFLSFFQAGVMYNFSAKNEDPRAWLYYESNYYDLTNRYIDMMRTMIINEIEGNKKLNSTQSGNGNLTIKFA